MNLIIYLASHDPSARVNYVALLDERQWNLGEDRVHSQFIEIDLSCRIKFSKPTDRNIFDRLSDSANHFNRVELIAHGDGSSWIKCMPKGQWDVRPNASNTYKDISAANLRDFFRDFAFKNGRYKFTELTIFCCSGYRFAKELATLMPEIEITCFNEYIEILGANGTAYPYLPIREGNQRYIKPIDKDGNIITPGENDRPSATHFKCPLHVFKGSFEKTVYESLEAIPINMMHLRYNTSSTGQIEFVGNFLELSIPRRGEIIGNNSPEEKKDVESFSAQSTTLSVENFLEEPPHPRRRFTL